MKGYSWEWSYSEPLFSSIYCTLSLDRQYTLISRICTLVCHSSCMAGLFRMWRNRPEPWFRCVNTSHAFTRSEATGYSNNVKNPKIVSSDSDLCYTITYVNVWMLPIQILHNTGTNMMFLSEVIRKTFHIGPFSVILPNFHLNIPSLQEHSSLNIVA